MSSEGKCPKCGAEPKEAGVWTKEWVCGAAMDKDGWFRQLDFCRGRADAIRELTEWRTGEPPEGVDVVLVKDIDYGTYTVMIRDSGELWSVGVGSLPWRKSFVWLPIPQ